MIPHRFNIDLEKWVSDDTSWMLIHECEKCPKTFEAHLNLAFFDPTTDNEEVPLMAQISCGFFQVRDMVQLVSWPLTAKDREDIAKHMKHTGQQLGGLIVNHYIENSKTHFNPEEIEEDGTDNS